MKKFFKVLFKIVGKLLIAALIFFVVTFGLYITNGENKLIYYVVRPLLNNIKRPMCNAHGAFTFHFYFRAFYFSVHLPAAS